MTSVSPHAPKNKPHYTYVLEYPEDYPEPDKAGTVFYVGKGQGERIHKHEREARNGTDSYKCRVIRKIWDTGCPVIKKILAHFETHEEACMYEVALIFFLPNLTNLTSGGDGAAEVVVSETTRRKLGEIQKTSQRAAEARRILHESNRGKKRCEGTGQRISEAKKKKGLSPRSEAHLHKLHETRKGCEQSLEHIQKRAAANTGKKRSEEACQNLSKGRKGKGKGKTPWNKGKPMSEEQKVKLRDREVSAETRRRLSESHMGHMPSNLEQLKEMARARRNKNA